MKWFLLLGFGGERVKPMDLETNLGLGILTVRAKVRVWAAPFVHSSSPIINFLNAFSGHQRYSWSLSSLHWHEPSVLDLRFDFHTLCFFRERYAFLWFEFLLFLFIMRWRRREVGKDWLPSFWEMEERRRSDALGGQNGVSSDAYPWLLMLSWYLYLFYFRPFELLVALECICLSMVLMMTCTEKP